MNLNLQTSEENGKTVLHVSGEIDAYTAPQLKETLLSLTQRQGDKVEVNLEAVNYMDSTGLGVFVSALKSTKENESQLKLINLQDRVLRLFNITGLDEIMDVNAAGVRGEAK